MRKKIIIITLTMAALSSFATASDVCTRIVKENREALIQVGFNSNEKDSMSNLSALADILHTELMEKIENEEVSLERAQLVFQQEVAIRQCANYYGLTPLKALTLEN